MKHDPVALEAMTNSFQFINGPYCTVEDCARALNAYFASLKERGLAREGELFEAALDRGWTARTGEYVDRRIEMQGNQLTRAIIIKVDHE